MKDRAEQAVLLVLTLARDAELDLLPEVISGPQLAAARSLAELVHGFNYLESAEFASLSTGKSPAFVAALQRRYRESVAARAKRDEFFAAVRGILSGSDIARFLPAGSEAKVNEVRARLEALHAT